MRQWYDKRLWRLISCLACLLNGCYKTYSDEPEAERCASQIGHATVEPVDSVVVFRLDDGNEEEVEPSGTLVVSGGDCVASSCEVRIDRMDINIPSPTLNGVAVSNVVLSLEAPGAQGIVDESQGLVLRNSTFTVLLSADVDGVHTVQHMASNDNIGGGYDVEEGIIVLAGWLASTRSDEITPPVFPNETIDFLFTAYIDCID